MSIGEDPSGDHIFHGHFFDISSLLKSLHIDFIIKMSNVTDDSVIFHSFHVVSHDNVSISGGGNKDINISNNGVDISDLDSFHTGLEGTDRVNFSDKDLGVRGFHGSGTSFTNISVS